MKKHLLVLMLCTLAGTSMAAEQEISADGKVVSYIASAKLTGNNKIEATPGTVFIGERILRNDEGRCFKETSSLQAMNSSESNGLRIDLPDVQIRRVGITCPA